jgi:hypothetical protein
MGASEVKQAAAAKVRGGKARSEHAEAKSGSGIVTGKVADKAQFARAMTHAEGRRRPTNQVWGGLGSDRGIEAIGGKIKDGSVRGIFYQRTVKWVLDIAESAPAEVLQEALARTSARGTIVYVLGEVPVEQEKSEEEILLERAQERALVVQEQLRREAGGLESTQEVVDRTGLSRQTVDRYRKEGKLLALQTAQGFQFPLCQFHGKEIVPDLDEVLPAMQGGSFWETLSGLITPTPLLNGKSMLEALRAGASAEERARIVSIAHDYAHE